MHRKRRYVRLSLEEKMKVGNAIEVRHVTKKFRVYMDRGHTLKEIALFKKRRQYEERTVLNDISFEVKRGEAIGLIGQNGCGKSTTLKLLTRIMYPDSGEIEMKGRVSSLIELGAGFHPDMTGRQNIYTNASIFGLTRKEIEKRVDDIIAFSELGDVVDTPVRTYSSGMYMRLAFAVAINVDADILLIDEILAVGDAAFQAKCFEKLHEIKRKGTTIVIVSHSMGQIEQICDKSIWIHEGKIRKIGEPKIVDEEYLYAMDQKRMAGIELQKQMEREQRRESVDENDAEEEQDEALAEEQAGQPDLNVEDSSDNKSESQEVEDVHENEEGEEQEPDKWAKLRDKVPAFADSTAIRMGTGEIEFTDVELFDEFGKNKNVFKTGDKIIIEMKYKTASPGLKGNFGIGIFRDDGVYCYGTNIEIEQDDKIVISKKGYVRIIIEQCLLLRGKYFLDVAVHGDEGYYYDDIRRVLSFYMTKSKREDGVFRLETKWEAGDI